jgi:hypothetical protein
LEALEKQGQVALLLHDGSELEKPESVRVEGLCPVRSAKGRRLSRPGPKVQCISPTAGAPMLVPGIHWHAAALIGLKGLPCVAKMRSWTSRGPHATQGRLEEERLPRHLARTWGRRVIHLIIKLRAVHHAAVPGTQFFLIVASAKDWSTPWYLLTNEPLARVQDALRIVQIYSRRWHIEGSFRVETSALGSEHIRVRQWEAHLGVGAVGPSDRQTGASDSTAPLSPPSGALPLVANLSSPTP